MSLASHYNSLIISGNDGRPAGSQHCCCEVPPPCCKPCSCDCMLDVIRILPICSGNGADMLDVTRHGNTWTGSHTGPFPFENYELTLTLTCEDLGDGTMKLTVTVGFDGCSPETEEHILTNCEDVPAPLIDVSTACCDTPGALEIYVNGPMWREDC